MAIADWTTTVWATAFNDEVEKMIGLSAHELKELEESNLDDFQNKFTDIAFHSFIFKLRMNMRVYNVILFSLLFSIYFVFYIFNHKF